MMLIGRKAKAGPGKIAGRRAPFWHRMSRRNVLSERDTIPSHVRVTMPGSLSPTGVQGPAGVQDPAVLKGIESSIEPAARTALDPVSLAVLVISNVAPASMRACVSGLPVEVKAPDEATATVIRAALAETSRRRTTDRLISVVVAAK